MLGKDSWLDKALSLQDKRSSRVDHDCGGGRTLLLSREGPTLRATCFRCNDYGIHTIEEPLSVRIARLNEQKEADTSLSAMAELPEGERDPSKWPAEARLWFARAGLHSGDIGALGAILDSRTGRVILPTGPGFWQARAIRKGQVPKYIAPLVNKVYPIYGEADRITLTEDILSAYKVGQVGEGWCMLGTALPNELLIKIMKSGKAVNVWLDNDLPPLHKVNRGQIAAVKVMAKLRAHGITVRNIVTSLDPKLTPYSTIKELV